MAKDSLSVSELQRRVEAGKLAPVYIVLGSEQGLRRRVFEALDAAIAGGDGDADLATVRLDGAEMSIGAIVDEARSLPLFAMMGDSPSKLVWVARFDAVSLSEMQPLVDYVEEPVEATCLVLEAGKLDRRKASVKRLAAAAQVVDCEPPKREADVRRWVEATIRSRGLEIDRDALVYLMEMAGDSITVLESEIEKAALAAGEGGRIRVDDLQTLVGRSREHSVFELTDSLVRADRAGAIRLLNRLLDDGEEPLRLLPMVAWITRQLVIAHDLAASGMPKREAMNAIGGRWQTRGAILDRARRASRRNLAAALAECAEADIFVKRLRDARSGTDKLRPARGKLESLCRQICAA